MAQISIVTVNYNNGTGLKKTFNSLFSQTHSEYEYIVIDGGSSDESKELIIRNNNKIKYWISEKDNGIFDGMNKGIKIATGDYLMFLNSGDYLVDNQILSKLHSYLNAPCDIFYGNIQILNSDTLSTITFPDNLSLNFWENCTINHQASLIKASLFKEMGLYETTYDHAADYVFFLKCFFASKSFFHINETVVNYDLGGDSYLNRLEYKEQMNKGWKEYIPAYLDTLYQEHKEYNHLMQYRIMRWAKTLNRLKYKMQKIFS
jgi:glycosyltransferase involved in cell wall biosynthesis